MQQRVIDTHLHLWDLQQHNYAWLTDYPALNLSLTFEQRAHDFLGIDVIGSVFVECDADEDSIEKEASWACKIAEHKENHILGVIAGCRPDHPDFDAYLDRIQHRKLIGMRRVLHSQPDELLRSPKFAHGLRQIGRAGLSFDLCLNHKQLPAATELVRRCPETRFVLDHCGNPPVDPANRATWLASIREIAREANVVACKLSGLLGAVDRQHDPLPQLRNIISDVAQAFGYERLLFGSDWPVCRLGGSIRQWIDAFNLIIADWQESARHRVLVANAMRVYGLGVG